MRRGLEDFFYRHIGIRLHDHRIHGQSFILLPNNCRYRFWFVVQKETIFFFFWK